MGVGRLAELAPALAGPGALVLCGYPLICVWDVWGWKVLLAPSRRPAVPFGELFLVRLAGEALNSVTPFVDVGGEFLKVQLCVERFALTRREALTSVVMARTALFVSEALFWIVGLALLLPASRVPADWSWALIAGVGVCVALAAILLFLQRRGLFAAVLGWVGRFRPQAGLLERFHVSAREADAEVARTLSARDGRFASALGLHFVGWLAGGVETYFMFRLVGAPVTLADGLALEAMLQLLRTVSFFIPGNLGAQEAGMALLAQWMGFHPSLGVAVSLLKRLRQLVWTAAGFAVWGKLTVGKSG